MADLWEWERRRAREKQREDQRRGHTAFALAALQFCRRSGQVGLDRAVAEQLETPTLNTRDWAVTITSLAGGRAPEPESLGRCQLCAEGLETRLDEQGQLHSRFCRCTEGQKLAAGHRDWLARKEQERKRQDGRRPRRGGLRRMTDPPDEPEQP